MVHFSILEIIHELSFCSLMFMTLVFLLTAVGYSPKGYHHPSFFYKPILNVHPFGTLQYNMMRFTFG